MTSLIAAAGSGRSASVIPVIPAVRSVTTIAFIRPPPAFRSLRTRGAHSHQVLICAGRHDVIVSLWAAGPGPEEVAMQILIVNFNLDGLTEEEFVSSSLELAPVFAELPGLASKVWLADRAE